MQALFASDELDDSFHTELCPSWLKDGTCASGAQSPVAYGSIVGYSSLTSISGLQMPLMSCVDHKANMLHVQKPFPLPCLICSQTDATVQ